MFTIEYFDRKTAQVIYHANFKIIPDVPQTGTLVNFVKDGITIRTTVLAVLRVITEGHTLIKVTVQSL